MAFPEGVIKEIKEVAREWKLDGIGLVAVVAKESGGVVFATVRGRNEPLIRFEGHYFDKLVPAHKREQARNAGVSSPIAGKIKNPASQSARWDLLLKAANIDAAAAYMSCSWGVGQVMGSHWKMLGYKSVMEMVQTARASLYGQVELMARYIVKNNLAKELNSRDWSAFAAGYNGKNYKKNNYDTDLAKLYALYGGTKGVTPERSGYLRLGSKGAGVRDVQAMLVLSGYKVVIDGDFGKATKDAVIAFQKANGLSGDGIVGPKTQLALSAVRDLAPKDAGQEKITEIAEVQQGTIGAIATPAIIISAKGEIQKVVDQLAPYESLSKFTEILQTGLGIMTVLGIAAGVAYAIYGWRKSKKSYTGTYAEPVNAFEPQISPDILGIVLPEPE